MVTLQRSLVDATCRYLRWLQLVSLQSAYFSRHCSLMVSGWLFCRCGFGADNTHSWWHERHRISVVITTSIIIRIGKPVSAWHFSQAIGNRQSFSFMSALILQPRVGMNNDVGAAIKTLAERKFRFIVQHFEKRFADGAVQGSLGFMTHATMKFCLCAKSHRTIVLGMTR